MLTKLNHKQYEAEFLLLSNHSFNLYHGLWFESYLQYYKINIPMNESKFENSTIFMTGATSGFGKLVACSLANQGAELIVMARNKEKGEQLLANYASQYPQGKGEITLVEGNLNSFESVARACEEVRASYPKLDTIILNAGIMNFEYIETVDGIEETLQVNLLSPLLITHLLMDSMLSSPAPKIIFTASALHQGIINFDDLEFKTKFSSFKSYRQSKLGVILLSRLLATKMPLIPIYSHHPGMIRTELGRNAGLFSRLIFWAMGKGLKEGTHTLMHLLETPAEELISGEYYANRKVTKTTPEAYDLTVAEKLLEVCGEYLYPYLQEQPSTISGHEATI
jgi:NAD(P)-dependent dehydrogenase (short-subunit alcohol dehydrogenase family)